MLENWYDVCAAADKLGKLIDLPLERQTGADLPPSQGVHIRLDGVLNSVEEPLCPADSFFDVLVNDVPLNSVPLPCASSAQIGPLTAGLELLDVVVRDETGTDVARGSCGAEVAPGKTTTALCVADE